MRAISDSPLEDCLVAMADETRRRILALLRDGEMNVHELTNRCVVAQPTISHHLAILRRARLVRARREGRQRFYRANADCVATCCREIQTRFGPPDVAAPRRPEREKA